VGYVKKALVIGEASRSVWINWQVFESLMLPIKALDKHSIMFRHDFFLHDRDFALMQPCCSRVYRRHEGSEIQLIGFNLADVAGNLRWLKVGGWLGFHPGISNS
jgi:hypothetical protein